MISVSNREWSERKFNENLVNKCSQDNNFSQILSKLIVTRNFIDDEIYTINNSKNVNFSNVFKFNSDFNKSIDLVIKNIKNKSKICILGDYDVDGSCATALLIKFLKSINQPIFFYIPDRIIDVYGPSIKLFKEIINKSKGLLILSKCNSSSKTGVEMEALLSVSITALTIYDMCKSIDKSIEIREIRLLSKKGGKSGNYKR